MTAQTPETTVPADPKPRFRDRFNRTNPNETTPKTKSIKDKAKGVATVLGVVTVAGVVAATVAKKTAKDVETESTPDVETTPDN